MAEINSSSHGNKVKRRLLHKVMNTQLFSSVECSDRLGVPLYRIAYAQRVGRLPKPSRLVAGKAIYSIADLRRMAKVFGVELDRLDGASDDATP